MANKVINVEVSLGEVRGDQNKLIRKFVKKCKKENYCMKGGEINIKMEPSQANKS